MKGKQLLCCEVNIREEEWRPQGPVVRSLFPSFLLNVQFEPLFPVVKVGEEEWELCNLEACPPSPTATSTTTLSSLCASTLANNGSDQLQGEVRLALSRSDI